MDLNIAFAQFSFKMGTKARMNLWRKLARLLRAPKPILESLQILHDQRARVSKESHPECVALRDWIRVLNNGGALGSAIKGWVTDDEQMLVSAGEQRGDLPSSLDSLHKVIEVRSKVVSEIIGGSAYPVIMLFVSFGLLYMYSYKIIPIYANVAKGGQWEGAAASLVWLADFTRQWLWLVIVAMVGGFIAFMWSLPRFDGPVRIWLDRFAPYSIYRVLRGSSWLISLAALVGVGIRIEDALVMLQSHNSKGWLAHRTQLALNGIRRGVSLGEALYKSNTDFPDRETVADLLVYSDLGRVAESLKVLGGEMLDNTIARIRAQMVVLKQIGILLVAGVIGWTTSGLMSMNAQLGTILQNVQR